MGMVWLANKLMGRKYTMENGLMENMLDKGYLLTTTIIAKIYRKSKGRILMEKAQQITT
jgi:hypothetical protein